MDRVLPDENLPWPIPWDAVVLIASIEKLALKSYKCPAGVWTIGWGETQGVGPGMEWTKEKADKTFCDELTFYSDRIKKVCTVEPSQNELGGMTSLAYNIGLGAFTNSTVLKQHNAGNTPAAARAFKLWNQYTDPRTKQKVESSGLTSRRFEEAALYLKPDYSIDTSMPQAVRAESSLVRSPMALSGGLTAATGALSLLSGLSDQAKIVLDVVSDMAQSFGVKPPVMIAGTLLVVGIVVIYNRYKQRAEGWA